MYRLYFHPLCPFSRKVRIHLKAKDLDFELVQENFWERRKEFIAMNPSGSVPVLFDNQNANLIIDSSVIVEYIEENHQDTRNFLGDNPIKRTEVRRLQRWFDEKFYHEVSKYILTERYFNRFSTTSKAPDSEILRISRRNLNTHLSYIEFLLESRKYLAGDQITIADFSAASHISVLDYFGDINWSHFTPCKDWYCLIKSHKIFGDILKDRIANINPPEWYSKLDY